jgi:ATP-dependent Lon protease
MHPETSEYAMLRTYLEWIADLPWSVKTRDRLNLKIARKTIGTQIYKTIHPVNEAA